MKRTAKTPARNGRPTSPQLAALTRALAWLTSALANEPEDWDTSDLRADLRGIRKAIREERARLNGSATRGPQIVKAPAYHADAGTVNARLRCPDGLEVEVWGYLPAGTDPQAREVGALLAAVGERLDTLAPRRLPHAY